MNAVLEKNRKTIVEVTLTPAAMREGLGLPLDAPGEQVVAMMVARAFGAPDGTVARMAGEDIVLTWNETQAKAPKKKEPAAKEPEPAPGAVSWDWNAAIAKDRPSAADITEAEKAAGKERVAEVRARMSIGAGVTSPMLAMASNGKQYIVELRGSAPAGAK